MMKINTVLCQVQSMDRALSFYRDLLGLTPESESPHWSQFDLGGAKLGLHTPFSSKTCPQGCGWILGLEVENIQELRKKLQCHDFLVGEYHELPHGVIMDFQDADGYPLQAIQLGAKLLDLS